eukprot:TRINITY_DN10195_c0_g1_i1.p1 TRINITY_DN10195_c0_g1~~TRINITY_DN10195_c0_g1_i1.p1  ORF type:complete len:309 (+),score=38.50 TRINITY_DN10195_c0_g1_i1:1-927(+)
MWIYISIFILLILVVVKKYFINKPCHHLTNSNIQGKFIAITGGTSGLGYEAAKYLSQKGAHLLFGCRSEAKKTMILKELGSNATVLTLDLKSLESVEAFVQQIVAIGKPIDYLINNAGMNILGKVRNETYYNYEVMVGVNHLAHFLLTTRLLEKSMFAENCRIVTTSSSAHKMYNYDLELLDNSTGMKAYGLSKMANILFTRELQTRVHPSVICVSRHPGAVHTPLSSAFVGPTILQTLFHPILMFILRSPWMGAQSLLHCVFGDVEKGGYYYNCSLGALKLPDNELEERLKLWNYSADVINNVLDRD